MNISSLHQKHLSKDASLIESDFMLSAHLVNQWKLLQNRKNNNLFSNDDARMAFSFLQGYSTANFLTNESLSNEISFLLDVSDCF